MAGTLAAYMIMITTRTMTVMLVHVRDYDDDDDKGNDNDNDIGDDDVYFFLLQKLYCKHYNVLQCITKQDSEYINK